MGNKLIYLLAFAGLMAINQRANAPVRLEPYFHPPAEKVIIADNPLEKIAKDDEKRLHDLDGELSWLPDDKIYQKVILAHSALEVPKYITRKFIRCMGYAESTDKLREISKKGARGWGQLMKETWYEVETLNYEENAFNFDINLDATLRSVLMADKRLRALNPNWGNLSSEEKVSQIAAAYNGGIGRLQRAGWDVNKMPLETRGYMPRIRQAAEKVAPKVSLFY